MKISVATGRRQEVAAIVLSIMATIAITHACAAERFTVADSIAMTRLTDPDPALLTFFDPNFKVSPDQRLLAIVTMRGDVASGVNSYSLLIYDLAKVARFIRERGDPEVPQPKVAATMGAREYQYSTDHAIDAVRWLGDSATIAFIGRDSLGTRQAYMVDTHSGTLKQLTHHAFNVEMFDISRDGNTVVYGARHPPDWTERDKHGHVIASDWMQDLARGDRKDATVQIRYFALDVSTGVVTPVKIAPGILSRAVAVAPDGRHAVIFAQSSGIPSGWTHYKPIATALPDSVTDQDAFGSVSPWLGQFLLVDTRTGEARPLLDAPAKLDAVASALWSSDSTEVVVAKTFLPLNVRGPELEHRKESQAVAAVNVVTGDIAPVTSAVDALPDGRRVRLRSVERLKDGSIVIVESLGDRTGDRIRRFVRNGTRWTEGRRVSSRPQGIKLRVVQGLNEPPEIAASDPQARERAFTDLNPQFRQLAMGRAEEYSWKDKQGHLFAGALVLPPDYSTRRRYPVILQSSALPFRSDIFLIDGFGTATSAFAARAFAAEDIVVLQMPVASTIGASPSNSSASYNWERDGEAPRFLAMMEGAIDALDSAGMIDRTKIGLIGFSRTGVHVSYALAFARTEIAAATLADALAATPFAQSMMYGIPSPAGMLEFEQPALMGRPFWGDDGVSQWISRSPFFHLDRMSAALRIETYGLGIPAYWDTFALLKRQQYPVEMVHIPRGHHVLITPYSRVTSQQGNVDWFKFWLKDEEDPAAEKAEQYARWRKLRALKERAQRPAADQVSKQQ